MSTSFVRIYRANGDPEAGMIRFLLEGAGIEVEARGSSLSGLGGEIPFEEAWIEILVPEANREKALSLIREKAETDSNPSPSRLCPNCNSQNDGGFTVCWKCQADLETGAPPPQPSSRAAASAPSPRTRGTTSGGWLSTFSGKLNMILGLALVALGYHAYELSQNQMPGDHPLHSYGWDTSGECIWAYWRSSGDPVYSDCDHDGNGMFEEYTEHFYDGKIQCRYIDENENGIYERMECYNHGGRRTVSGQDRNEDRFFEDSTFHFPDGRVTLRDLDGDHIHEYREHYDSADHRTGTYAEDGPNGLRKIPPKP